jgi:hypothetical protein|tara:strand:+ start:108 stop:221 length:114 start_codon:yes stop_codon:yes gene_type:complete
MKFTMEEIIKILKIKENWLKYFEGTKEDILMVYLKMD